MKINIKYRFILMKKRYLGTMILSILMYSSSVLSKTTDPLPSWIESPVKSKIIDFVQNVTDKDSKYYVVPEDRIATFDNDGTLWPEKPMPFQLLFAIDKIKDGQIENPRWKTEKPYSHIVNDELDKLKERDLLEILNETHTGMSWEEFDSQVKSWVLKAKHPETNLPYTKMVYQPMLELLRYLEDNDFKNFIVSGGGNAFMRAWAPEVYNIPSERIIGSQFNTKLIGSEVYRAPNIIVNDDKEEKPQQIFQQIGKRPIASFGNSDGDLQMLQWTMLGKGKRLALFVHHTDQQREWKYDRESTYGSLNKGLDVALDKGWLIVDMKKDWRSVYGQ